MDKNRVKGKLDDSGRVKRQVGEWTGDTEMQAEGAVQQVKGKALHPFQEKQPAAFSSCSARLIKDKTQLRLLY